MGGPVGIECNGGPFSLVRASMENEVDKEKVTDMDMDAVLLCWSYVKLAYEKNGKVDDKCIVSHSDEDDPGMIMHRTFTTVLRLPRNTYIRIGFPGIGALYLFKQKPAYSEVYVYDMYRFRGIFGRLADRAFQKLVWSHIKSE